MRKEDEPKRGNAVESRVGRDYVLDSRYLSFFPYKGSFCTLSILLTSLPYPSLRLRAQVFISRVVSRPRGSIPPALLYYSPVRTLYESLLFIIGSN